MRLIKSSCFLLSLLFLVSGTAFGQGRGAILDEEAYHNLPRAASLAASAYKELPASFSLRQYAPLPGDQEDYGTCVGWAVGYAARTISESVALNRLNQTETTQNAFSPTYIYRHIRPDDTRGMYGAQIYTALDYMRDSGAVKMIANERTLPFSNVELALFKNSRAYPIGDYVTLFSRDDRQKPALITRIVKKSLSEGRPVVIGMNTPDSFLEARNVWRPRENPRGFYGGHAMCVVGYDDNRYGGAFEILNSWGRKWGNGGYIWIPYQTFVDFVTEAYEIIENIASFSDTISFNGFAQMEIVGVTANAGFVLNPEGYYTTTETYSGGTRYRFNVGAKESAYVYTFSVSQHASDGRFYSPILLFPQAGVSALLNYTDSIVTLPGEETTLTMNQNEGTEYIITLYAKQALDIQAVMRRFESASGALSKKLAAAVGDNLMTDLAFSETEAAFTATPDNPRIVTALVVAIEHR
jgi:C1A family cysteine protease